MMKIGVLGKITKNDTDEVVQELIATFERLGHETVRFSSHEDIDGVDVVVVLGGDGAILHAAVPAAQKGVKIIGINYGHLGFLTEYEKDEHDRVTDLIAAVETGNCQIVKRSLLQITIGENTFYALNEVAIQRDNSLVSAAATQILTVEVTAKEGKDQIAGDGLLICTPTGSTAYSLSAGGPIIDSATETIGVTPICPHSFFSRSILFSPKAVLRLTNSSRKNAMYAVNIDGRNMHTILSGEYVDVSVASEKLRMLSVGKHGVLDALREKMLISGVKS